MAIKKLQKYFCCFWFLTLEAQKFYYSTLWPPLLVMPCNTIMAHERKRMRVSESPQDIRNRFFFFEFGFFFFPSSYVFLSRLHTWGLMVHDLSKAGSFKTKPYKDEWMENRDNLSLLWHRGAIVLTLDCLHADFMLYKTSLYFLKATFLGSIISSQIHS